MNAAKAITDRDVLLLANIAGQLHGDYKGSTDAWEGSPFAWVKSVPSRQRGKIGEQLVAGWCAAKGLDVTRCPDSEADLMIGGHRVEVKMSTLWASGAYTFQQIRDQDYEYAMCLGIAPFDARCWVISKQLLRRHVIGHRPQHRGSRGTDTFWLSFPANEPEPWMAECGGSMAAAFHVLRRIAEA